MLFSLPWDLRATIWARARFLAARDALAAHLPARAGCRRRSSRFVAEARLSVGGCKVITVRRSLIWCNIYDHFYKISRDLETVRVTLSAIRGLVFVRIAAGQVEEQWGQLETTGEWKHTHRASRAVEWPILD